MSASDRHFVHEPPTIRYLAVYPQTLGHLRFIAIGDVELQVDGHQLFVRGAPVNLPHKEFLLLRQLMGNAGRVVSRRELLDAAWGPRTADRKYLEVHIRRLRCRIEENPDSPTHIRTVRGVGYVFDFPPDS
ncbi:winged helix-turn-helix domain-containing protein [Pseudonocardia acidicola]|uniref:Winged helix-turn-helix transcriptional regulator n=1 Tax=Pseudonocardia acidicola TaxID=2724939 RepID=A0ABX1SFT8_9PSEU|nr:winged helix-turn-helix domain-containing protein [Pseudonocardia acidicola]NMH99667.1 winged helix-turn-helix transcriptional regulator [Pseudonocardia acidicola]